jgi:hypothetical protein
MRAIPVEVALGLDELHLKVGGRPEQRAIQALASNGPNQTLDEGMRARRVGHTLDFFDIEDAQIRLRSVELSQPIVI